MPQPSSQEDLWLMGGFPDGGALNRPIPPVAEELLEALAGRDLPVWGLPASPPIIGRLFRMLAATHGRCGMEHDRKSLGLSYHTVNTYWTTWSRPI